MVLEPEHRASMRRQAQPYRSRSLSPRAPYLWQDREVDVPSVERRSRKGWYRVDYGPEKSDEVLYLPSFKDRMNFLERSVNRATSEPRIRATSVPPLTVDVRRTKALSIDPIVRDPYRWRTWPFYYYNYRRPYSNYYDMYWPTLGPYSGRIWRLPWYRYPSSPLTTSTAWRYVSSPYSSYSATTTIGPDCTEVMEERRSLSPPPVHYRPPASTQLILNRVALGRSSVPPRSYPPARYTPRYYPSYLDYDYGYGGYYYPPYYPRLSRYDYLDDLDSPYLSSSYRPRALDLDTDYREKMLQDHVENMRFRLKSLAHSLDPTGPVPEIVIPERSTTTKKSTAVALPEEKKSYSSSAMEFSELPKLASRRQRYYPEDDHMKDNLRIQCLSHYKTTRTAADYPKTRLYDSTGYVMPETSYRSSKFSASKWEEPDTVFGGPSDKKPYSKDSGRVRFDSSARKAITDGTSEEVSEEKKERRKKKKSKERDVPEASTDAATASATAAADHSTSEADPVSATTDEAGTGDAAEDEKERKRQEKKKRKAEREAAAKAAMEAELAALAAAEAELARLEAESNKKEAPAPAPAPAEAAPAEAAPAEVKSESAAEKCESSTEVVYEGVCVTPELAPPQTPPQVPPQEPQVPEEPPAAQETEQAVEPQAEEPQPEPPAPEEPIPEDLPPLKDTRVEPPAVEEPQAEPPAEEPPAEVAPEESPAELPVESPAEPPAEEASAEPPVEEAPVDSPAEPPVEEAPAESAVEEAPVESAVEEAPVEPAAEVPQMEEPQTEPTVEEPQVEEPKPEPPVEAQVEAASVEEPVEQVDEPGSAPRRRPALDEDAGWLDAWDGEAAAAEAGAQEAGPQLGTDAIPEPATSTAEEARLGAQEDTEAAAEYTATTTDAADTTTHDPETAAVADIAAHTEADDHADAPPPARFDEEAE